MLPRTRYLPAAGEDQAQWCGVSYLDGVLTRREVLSTSGASDAYFDWEERISHDNGKTWSARRVIEGVTAQLPGGGMVTYPFGDCYDTCLGTRYERFMRRTWPGLPIYTFHWGDRRHPFDDHCFVAENGGMPRLLRYEDGPDFDPEDPFAPAFRETNRAYCGVGMAFDADGTVYYPLVCQPQGHGHTTGGVVLMRRDPTSGGWSASNQVYIAPERSSRGLLEPDVALLRNGTVLIVMRGSNTDVTAGRKWLTVSTDGGRTLEPVRELRYEDNSRFYSPSSIHRLVRSTRNGKLYWFANIVPEAPAGNGPRYPLCLAEIDDERVAVVRDSVLTVDDRGGDEPEALQLSNFSVLENRETLVIELFVTRLGEVPEHFWQGAVYKYVFSPPRASS